jgi:hypothetical protein
LLVERAKQFADSCEAAAFILDLHQHSFGIGDDPQGDARPGRVNLNAFCSRFIRTAVSTCRSAVIATP